MTGSDPAKRQRIGKIWRQPARQMAGHVGRKAQVLRIRAVEISRSRSLRRRPGRAHARGLFSRRWRAASSSCPRRSSGIRLTHAMRSISPTSNPGCWRSISMVWPRRRRERASTAPRILATPCSPKFVKRLPPAFKSVDCLLVATPRPACQSTPRGEPTNGRARFRAIFLLSRPLFFLEQRQLVAALVERPGLDCLDLSIYSVSQFTFVARPIFPDGMTDPIHKAGYPAQGQPEPGRRRRCSSADRFDTHAEGAFGTMDHVSAEERLLDVDPAFAMNLSNRLVEDNPERHRGARRRLDRRLHGIKGASGDPDWGKHIWLEFTARALDDQGEASTREERSERVCGIRPLRRGLLDARRGRATRLPCS